MHIKLIPLLERLFLIALMAGIVLNIYKMELPFLITISLGGLGLVYFLNTFQHLEIERREDEPFGLKELVGFVIIPRVLWISLAISVVGILFFNLNPDEESYRPLLYIGGLSLVTGIAILYILKFADTKYFDHVWPILYRAFPMLVANFYILFILR